MANCLLVCLLTACLLRALPSATGVWTPTDRIRRPEIFEELSSSSDDDERICQQATPYLHYDRHNQTRSDDEGDDDDDDDDDDDVSLRVFSSNFTGKQPIKVSVSTDRPFFGLLLQSRWQETGGGNGTSSGRFRAASEAPGERGGGESSTAKTVSCGGGGGDTLIAWFDQGSTSQRFLWTPSTEQEHDRIQFVSTVFLNDRKTITNVTSVHRIKGFSVIDHRTCGDLKGCFRYTSTKAMERREEEKETEKKEKEGSSCDVTSCQYLLTYRVEGSAAHFEMTGRAEWIAVGFSSDDKMGGDDVFMCVRNRRQQRVEVRRYLTELRHQIPTHVERNSFYNMETEARDGDRISCRFSRPLTVKFDQASVDLNAPWYQLYAWGQNSMGDGIMMHSLDRPPTSDRKLTLRHSRNEVRHAGSTESSYRAKTLLAATVVIAAATLVP